MRKEVQGLFTKPEINKHYLPLCPKGNGPFQVLFKELKTVPFSEEDRETLKKSREITQSRNLL